MTIKNIVFDFGGVLVDWNPRYMYKNVFSDHGEMENFLTHVCTDDWNIQQDKGRSLAEGTALLQNQFPAHHNNIQLFYDKWEDMLKGEIQENVNLLPRLKKNYKMYGLTNWSAETFPVALARYNFFDVFDGIVVSGIEKMIKPDDNIYLLLLDRYEIEAEQSLFIDDNIRNIEAAHRIGFHTIHFHDQVNLEEELKKMSLI